MLASKQVDRALTQIFMVKRKHRVNRKAFGTQTSHCAGERRSCLDRIVDYENPPILIYLDGLIVSRVFSANGENCVPRA